MRPQQHRPITAAATTLLGALCALTMTPATTAPASTVSASTGPIRAVPLRLPPDAARGDIAGSNLISIDCARPGACTAGGAYDDRRGAFQAMVATQVNGRWQRAVKLTLPSNFGGAKLSNVDSLDCAAPGYCTAVGDYSGSGERDFGFVAQESHSRWGRAHEIEPPAGASHGEYSQAVFVGVACTAPGTCVAVGYYTITGNRFEPMAATQTAGRWKRAVGLSPPANASHAFGLRAILNSVFCQRNGSCVAVGDYTLRSGNFAVMATSSVGGRWRRPAEIELPRGADPASSADLASVSCTGARSCTAVGFYNGGTAMAASETAGRWARAQAVNTLPRNGDATRLYALNSVSCVRAGDCVAVGDYTDKGGTDRPWAVTESAGHWVRPRPILLPANAATGALSDTSAVAVDCTASGDCAADGLYTTRSSVVTAMVADFRSR